MSVRINGVLSLNFPLIDMGDDFAEVAKDFLIFYTGDDGKEVAILTPAGFRTDGNSVPDWIPGMDANTGLVGAVVHDNLYRNKLFPKEVCDRIAGEIWDLDPMVSDATRYLMLAGLDSDIAREIYHGDDYVPEIVGQDPEIED